MTESGQKMGAKMEMDFRTTKPAIDLNEIQRKLRYYSRHENLRLYGGEEACVMYGDVCNYLSQPFSSLEDKQKAHGNFIWAVKTSLPTCFQKEAVALINVNIKQLDLSDKDKLNFLNYVLSMKNYSRFSEETYKTLSQFEIGDKSQESDNYNAIQSRNIFYKIKTLLDSKYKKTEEFQLLARRVYPFLECYARKCPQVSHQLVEEYAETLFKISSKFPLIHVSIMPLKNMMERTVNLKHNQVKMNNLFGYEEPKTKPQIDKRMMLKVLEMYKKYVLDLEKKEKEDNILYLSVTAMTCYIVKNYDYNSGDIVALRDVFGGPWGSTVQGRKLYTIGQRAQKAYKDGLPRKFDARNKTIDPIAARCLSARDM